MRKRLLMALLSAGLLGAMLPGVAVANGPVGGCPPSVTFDLQWELREVIDADDRWDNGNWADQNGDGWACYLLNPGQTEKYSGQASGAFTWKDNTNLRPNP